MSDWLIAGKVGVKMAALDADELKLLKLLREKGPQPYIAVAGQQLHSMMTLGLVDWLGHERDVRGWRQVRITERGIAQLEREGEA